MIGFLIDLLFERRDAKRRKIFGRIVPRLKHEGFRESARAAAMRTAPPGVAPADLDALLPLTRPFAGDLVVAYALDGDAEVTYIGQQYLDQHKVTFEQLHAAALENAYERFTAANRARQIGTCPAANFVWLESFAQDGLVTTTALLPSVWRGFEKKHGAPLLAVLPGRDYVAFLPFPDVPEQRNRRLVQAWIMKNAAIEAFEFSANHALSAHCYLVRDGVFHVHSQLGDPGAETAALLETDEGKALLQACDNRPPPGAPTH